MSNKAFSQLFSRWVNRVRRADAPRDARKGRARLRVEQVEDRLAPATLPPQVIPAVTVEETRIFGDGTVDGYDGTGDFQPQVVADPNDPNTLIYVASTGGGNIYGQYSHDGGQTWLPFTFNFGSPAVNLRTATNGINPATGQFEGNFRDPELPANVTPNVYVRVSNPAVAMGRDGTVYVAYLLHDADKTSGAVAVRTFTFTTPTTLSLFNTTQILYRWQGQDPVHNLTVAIDDNPAQAYTDPTNGATTQVNTNTGKAAYVAWNTASTAATQANQSGTATPIGNSSTPNFNPNTVWLAASNNGGLSFSTPVEVDDGGFYHGTAAAATLAAVTNPLIVFSSATVNPNASITPGQMNIFFSRVSVTNAQQVGTRFDNTRPDGGVAGQEAVEHFSFAGGGNGTPIAEAVVPAAGGNHIPTTTAVTTNVSFPAGGFNSSTDFNIAVAMSHPHLNHLQVNLVPPVGSGLPTLTLLLNRTLPDGTERGPNQFGIRPGLPDIADLGTLNGVSGLDSGATRGGLGVFDQEAPRWLVDPANSA
ncbi:MAG TPA: hypothetical protein VMZ71_01040, partial [Gemmataceae bacterium]|nr:hypothetical protein [Gemmataceae bacterium]